MKINKKVTSIILVLILVGLYLAYKFGFADYLKIENLKSNIQYFVDLVERHYLISVILYALVYFVMIALAIPSTAPMSMLGGFLFGTMPTVVISTIAATSGAIVSFLIFKFFSVATIGIGQGGSLSQEGKSGYTGKMGKFKEGLQEYGSFYLLFLHFTFLVPFFVINLLAAISGVSLWTFIWTTFIGFLPCAYVYAFSGQKLLSIRSINDIFSWHVILIIIMLLFVATLPMLLSYFGRDKKA